MAGSVHTVTGPGDHGHVGGHRDTAGRVAAVHRQTRRSLLLCVAFLCAAVVTSALAGPDGRWAALHLLLVGAVLTAISTATVFLAVTWSASPAPADRIVEAQRWLLVAGAVGVVVSIRFDAPTWATGTSAALVVAALVLLGWMLVQIRTTATVDRFLPAIDAYLLGIAAGVVGSIVGSLLGAGALGDHHPRLREAHLALNLFGLVGLVVAGTVPYMTATQARTKMSPRATPGAVWAVVTVLAAATLTMVIGHLSGDHRLAGFALGTYAVAVLALVRILPPLRRRQFQWAGPRVLQLLTGIAWWAGATIAIAWETWSGGDPARARLVLVLGGYAQILVASMAYLGPVVRGGGHVRLSSGFASTRSWIALGAGNAAAVAALVGARRVLLVALGVWVVDLLVRSAVLVRPAAPRPPAPGRSAPIRSQPTAGPSGSDPSGSG